MNKIQDGKTPETAFVIEDSSGEMTSSIGELIEKIYGGEDGSYFIKSESTVEPSDKHGRYKILFVEDSVGENHKVYLRIG